MIEILLHYRDPNDWAAQLRDAGPAGFRLHCVSEDVDLLTLTDLWPRIDILWHVLTPVTRHHIEAARSLKLIQKLGVGVNTIDLDAAKSAALLCAICLA